MITQILEPVTQVSNDRLDLFYGSPDPNKNIATRRARVMSPDEIRSKGYRDGFHNSGMLGSLCDNPCYVQGYNEGQIARPSAA